MHVGIYDLKEPDYDINVIAMESSIFASISGGVKRLGGYLSNNIEEYIEKLSDEYNLMTSTTRKELASIKSLTERDLEKMSPRLFALYIATPNGFGVPLLRILNHLEKENTSVFELNLETMQTLSNRLSDILTNEASRTVLSKIKQKITIEDVDDKDKTLMSLLKKGTGGKTQIETLVENKGRYLDGVTKAFGVFSTVKKSDFDKVNKLSKEISEKVEALRHLIEVEQEPITKEALKAIIYEIEVSAKLNTLMAKHQLMSFECARAYIKIANIIKKVTN